MSTRRPPFQVRIARILDLTPSVRDIQFQYLNPDDLQFRCGQFVMLHVPSEPKSVLRAYSIASSDQDTLGFRLLFKYVPNGKASEYVWKLKANDQVLCSGPFGRVFFEEPPAEQIVFLCTGTGLAPHLSYLQSKIDILQNHKVFLFFGVTQESEIFCEQDLIEIQKKMKHFHYHVVLSRPSLHWTGRKGYVQDFLHETHYLQHPTDFYLCGNGQMIKETKDLLERNGIEPHKIHSEAFF